MRVGYSVLTKSRSMSTLTYKKCQTLIRAYNKKRSLNLKSYAPEALVKMLNISSNGTKLDNLYKGPYVVFERVGNSSYNLVDLNSATNTIVNDYPVPTEQLTDSQRSDITRNMEEPTLVFNKILSHILTDKGVFQYHVAWKDGSTSWECAYQFNDPSTLRRYHARVRKLELAKKRSAPSKGTRAKRTCMLR